MLVQKRNGSIEEFSRGKLLEAVKKAASRVEEVTTLALFDLLNDIVDPATHTVEKLKEANTEHILHVDQLHILVENILMEKGYYQIAREYISYRERNKQSIFTPRATYKPFEYPELNKYVDAIQQSYWLHSEFDYTSDVQDFKIKLDPHQREAIRRSMLAISQVEVKVKDFWAKVGDVLPKPEIQEVGAVFAESECFDEFTEVLTEDGWCYFDELAAGDKVAQYNIDTGEISFAYPKSYVNKEYKGKMHHYLGKATDMCVTPKHEILVKGAHDSTFSKVQSQVVTWSRKYSYPTLSILEGSKFQVGEEVYPERKEVDYEGRVYCVEMPLGTVVTRRNGRVAIQGNCRHSRAYSFLLELLNLNEDFSEILEVPVFQKRFEYLSRSVKGTKTGDLKDYVEALLLFTLFIENVSLFSQFLVISTYNKELNVLSGMSNAIAATSLEENLHAMFGADLIKEIRKERPDMFTEEFSEMVRKLAYEAYEAESDLIDWIFEEGEDTFLTKDQVKAYVQKRMNEGLTECGFDAIFSVDEKLLEDTSWFDIQISSTMQTDFFKKRSNTYTKRAEAYSADSLF